MKRGVKDIQALIPTQRIEAHKGRLLVSGEILEEILYIEADHKIKSNKSRFGFNHTFPAPGVKSNMAVQGVIEVEHITSALLKNGQEVSIDYLLSLEIKVDCLPRKITERFLIHHTTELPPLPQQVKIVYSTTDTRKEEEENLDEEKETPDWSKMMASLECEIEEKLTDILEKRLQARVDALKEEILLDQLAQEQKKKNREEEKKKRILAASKQQKIWGFSTRRTRQQK